MRGASTSPSPLVGKKNLKLVVLRPVAERLRSRLSGQCVRPILQSAHEPPRA